MEKKEINAQFNITPDAFTKCEGLTTIDLPVLKVVPFPSDQKTVDAYLKLMKQLLLMKINPNASPEPSPSHQPK